MSDIVEGVLKGYDDIVDSTGHFVKVGEYDKAVYSKLLDFALVKADLDKIIAEYVDALPEHLKSNELSKEEVMLNFLNSRAQFLIEIPVSYKGTAEQLESAIRKTLFELAEDNYPGLICLRDERKAERIWLNTTLFKELLDVRRSCYTDWTLGDLIAHCVL